MSDVWLITGLPGAGKTTVARLLAGGHDRGAHIEGDLLRHCIVSGGAPINAPDEEAGRQTALNIHNQCLLARSFFEAGFVVVLDYLVTNKQQIGAYRGRLAGLDLHVVVLAPAREVVSQRDRGRAAIHGHTHEDFLDLGPTMSAQLRGIGLWLDTSALSPEQTVAEILSRRAEAKISR